MEIRVLRYFLAVASEKSISGASRKLNLTQPTLSRQLIELEEELGKKLFNRSNRNITLTEEGLILQKRATEIMELLSKTKDEINTSNEDASGEIFIGCAETIGVHFLAKIISHMQKTYPKIHFHFFSGNAEDISYKLDKGLIDFGVLLESVDISKYDFIKLPNVDTWGLLMLKSHPLAQKSYIKANDLFNIPLIVSKQTLARNDFSDYLGSSYNKLNIVATYNLLFNASILVEENVGIALCLDKIINTKNSNLIFIPLEPKLEIGLSIIWKKYQVFSKVSNMFLSYIQEELKS